MEIYKGCLNAAKSHLWHLPTLDKPVPDYPGESKEGLVIIPIFLTSPGDDSIEHHIAKSACWARRSWIKFSDVEKLDIAVKFYVELSVSKRVLPLLTENGINTDRDVIYFDGRRTMGEQVNHLGQKLAMFNDDQFKDYEWVWQIDSDNFLASPRGFKYPFFSQLINQDKTLYANNVPPFEDYMTIQHLHWWWYILDSEKARDNPTEKQAEWSRRAKMLCDPTVVDQYFQPYTNLYHVGGGLYGFPAQHFLSKHKEECEWFEMAGKLMQDDEAVFSLYISNGNEVGDICEVLDMPVVVLAEDIEKNMMTEKHFMNHVGRLDYEHSWIRSFGAL